MLEGASDINMVKAATQWGKQSHERKEKSEVKQGTSFRAQSVRQGTVPIHGDKHRLRGWR